MECIEWGGHFVFIVSLLGQTCGWVEHANLMWTIVHQRQPSLVLLQTAIAGHHDEATDRLQWRGPSGRLHSIKPTTLLPSCLHAEAVSRRWYKVCSSHTTHEWLRIWGCLFASARPVGALEAKEGSFMRLLCYFTLHCIDLPAEHIWCSLLCINNVKEKDAASNWTHPPTLLAG